MKGYFYTRTYKWNVMFCNELLNTVEFTVEYDENKIKDILVNQKKYPDEICITMEKSAYEKWKRNNEEYKKRDLAFNNLCEVYSL